ncbi:unnamed protein product [Lathyrus sativus]|nr:unnamed protein product [Lathyrus sativus]
MANDPKALKSPRRHPQLNLVICTLEERYKRNEHWSKIGHIPVIEINNQLTI